MSDLGLQGTVRASVGLYNNRSDIDRLVEAVDLACEFA
jgi:selenocysteine lyase/cysteine desulfurase